MCIRDSFHDTLTVAKTAIVGENVTIGDGDTVFSVCSEDNGLNHVVFHEIALNPVDTSQFPDGAVYAMEVNIDGVTRKQLFIT